MKTRMFDTGTEVQFVASTPTQQDKVRLAPLFDAWKSGGYKKIPLPK